MGNKVTAGCNECPFNTDNVITRERTRRSWTRSVSSWLCHKSHLPCPGAKATCGPSYSAVMERTRAFVGRLNHFAFHLGAAVGMIGDGLAWKDHSAASKRKLSEGWPLRWLASGWTTYEPSSEGKSRDGLAPKITRAATTIHRYLGNIGDPPGYALAHGYVVGAEIGVDDGRTSAALLSLMPARFFLILVDTWPDADRLLECVEATRFAQDRCSILKTTSANGSRHVHDRSLAFAFIDAAHDLNSCLQDLCDWGPKVFAGGYLFVHDYTSPKPGWDVVGAVERFLREHHEWTLEAEDEHSMMAILKRLDS